MIPGEYQIQPGDIELNVGRRTISLKVANGGTGRSRSARIITFSKPTTPWRSTVPPVVACA